MNKPIDDFQTVDLDSAKTNVIAAFKGLIADAENLLRATTNYSAEGVAAARAKFEEKLGEAKAKLADTQTAVKYRAEEAVGQTENYVKAHPWRALAAAVTVGALLALYMAPRGR